MHLSDHSEITCECAASSFIIIIIIIIITLMSHRAVPGLFLSPRLIPNPVTDKHTDSNTHSHNNRVSRESTARQLPGPGVLRTPARRSAACSRPCSFPFGSSSAMDRCLMSVSERSDAAMTPLLAASPRFGFSDETSIIDQTGCWFVCGWMDGRTDGCRREAGPGDVGPEHRHHPETPELR
ncbi:hypothetical protein D5F01_LYC04706 [Larimichthys crocea]|uniref:Uncharacterized protein n=1 Tax=Larimichthys crocea TaxID=215358 RepID=A0A6G0IWQ8_LARCR|nr:hypothetical protein D5F01_LYC04706 [Larimichthys crocea]